MRAQKFRIIRNTQNVNYNFFQIQLLNESSSSELMGSFNEIGSITFQQTKGEADWYGMHYIVETSRLEDLDMMSRIAKYINKHSDFRSQPDEIIKILKGVEHYICNQEFFRVADKGKYCYNVVCDGSNYGRFVAKNDSDATKKLVKFQDHRFSKGKIYTLGTKFLIE